jgi:hypothetical protein
MKQSKFTDEQIIGFPEQADASMSVKELCRSGGLISPPSISGVPSLAAWGLQTQPRFVRLRLITTSSRSFLLRRNLIYMHLRECSL